MREGQEITARLSVVKGPLRAGEQFFLAGEKPVEIGKLPEKALSLLGTMVSRNHCRLVPADGEWKIADGRHPVLVRQGPCLGSSFHPELTSDRTVHSLFVELATTSLAARSN